MTERSNAATPQRPAGQRILNAPLVTMDLDKLSLQIRQEQAWKDKDRNAMTIFNNQDMSIVLLAFHQGAELKTHTAAGIISVQVLEGKIRFVTADETVERRKGEMLTLHEKIPHSVFAVEETVFLLTHVKPRNT